MTLPRKRKKLETKSKRAIPNAIHKVENEKELEKPDAVIDMLSGKEETDDPTTVKINAVSEDKIDELMAKASDILEKIEQAEKGPRSRACPQNRGRPPRRIRVRITLEDRFQKLDKTSQGLIENAGNPIGVDFRIPIPAFFWKVPVFTETAKFVIRRLNPME